MRQKENKSYKTLLNSGDQNRMKTQAMNNKETADAMLLRNVTAREADRCADVPADRTPKTNKSTQSLENVHSGP